MNATTIPLLRNNHREDGWLAVAIAATIVESCFFALRVYGRWVNKTRWWLDDYLVALSYLAVLSLNAVGIAITTATWDGQHTELVLAADEGSVILFLKLQVGLAATYGCAAIIPKMAIVAIFTRIFIQRPFRIICWILQAILLAYLISVIAVIFSSCVPFSANWQLPTTFTPDEHCVNITSEYRAVSIPNVLTDLAIIILPIPVVLKLQRTTLEKIGILSTFCLGLVGLAFSIARLLAFFTRFSDADVLWTSAYTGIFTTLEPTSYFLVACMLTFRQLKNAPCFARVKGLRRRDADMEEQQQQDDEPRGRRQGSDQITVVAVDSNYEDSKAGVSLVATRSLEQSNYQINVAGRCP